MVHNHIHTMGTKSLAYVTPSTPTSCQATIHVLPTIISSSVATLEWNKNSQDKFITILEQVIGNFGIIFASFPKIQKFLEERGYELFYFYR